MEDAVENLSRYKYKSKLDMRSGFWKVSLSPEAQNLCAFITPSGRIFKPLVMPFGLSNAPPIFQELMEKVVQETKMHPKAKHLFRAQTGHVAAFFNDSGLGANTIEDALLVLDVWLEVCAKNNVRVKLRKCEFVKEEI